MNAQKEMNKLFHELMTQKQGQVFLCSSDITLRVFDDASKISLSCPVYFGSNYIPGSVREAIKKNPPFGAQFSIRTYFNVEEDQFRIFLNYRGSTEELNNSKFVHLVKEFEFVANEWKIFLDEHDQRDLVYVFQTR